MPISYQTQIRSDPILYSLKNSLQLHPHLSNQTLAPILNVPDKNVMIDRLIHAAADILNSIKSTNRSTRAISTTDFIREILKRSRATYSMLQLALFYIFRIKKTNQAVPCSRRMFLAALIIASKYLNDKNYKNKAWAKITSLTVHEINSTEIVFLKLIDYQLYVSKPLYDKWVSLLINHIQKRPLPKETPGLTSDSASDTSSPPSTPPPVTISRKRSCSFSPMPTIKHQRQL
ncbi:cyclin-domain-containing protein [Mucor mucedo]|uniref:cyclin-domain-containing protein n=1 Tax=Mucor mucedo TaxID=29922 RepID=UPI00221F64DC|nr:cyclin-domain-containing protein [Mucor mucedo]KAI7891596.1 cyclin-domain-containing protein [Mucor mucedo]